MRDDTSDVRGSKGRALPPGWYIRDPVPADYGSYQYPPTASVSGASRDPRNNRPRPPRSWQAGNGWYSRSAIALSIGTLVALLLIGILL